MFQYVLFDLDGTLTDPREGITKSVQFALMQQGIHEPDLSRLEPFIGPPLLDSFMDFYDMTQEQAAIAVADYRKRFAPIGIFENKVYAGIPEMLGHLKDAGIKLAVASSKPEEYVIRILEHFQLDGCFDVVVGSNMDGSRCDKEEVVEEALRRLGKDLGTGAMVGDRKFDINGGKQFGLTTVGVAFGYAGKGELEAAGADYIAKTVSALEAFLLKGTGAKKKDANGNKTVAEPKESPDGKSAFFMKAWEIMFPFILYYLGSNVCYIVIITLFRMLLAGGAGFDWMHENSVGMASLAKACSMLAGAGVLIPFFRKEQTAWQARTEASFPTMGFLAASSALGINIVFGLLQIAAMSIGYYETERMQYQIPFLPGLILYGLISPLAEELLFRGMIYNRMKKYFSIWTSGIASSALFGLYHGNVVQTLYGMLMGMILVYAYEMTGNFKIPVMMHGVANACVFTTTYYPAVGTVTGMPVNCVLFLVVSGVCFGMIQKKRIEI